MSALSYQAAVTLLDAAGVDFTTLGNVENCCGTPMLVAGKWEIFAETMKKNIAAVKASGADTVVSSCPACDMMWRNVYPEWAAQLGVEFGITAKHYSELVAEKIKAGDFRFPGAINKKVTWHDSCHIGWLGPVGGFMFTLMKPVFPVLFPKLLPGMMPKVMPAMLERVGAMIPMPDYMAEQMPDLMPKVMDNLMPHMLPDVVPLAVPKMIAHLRGRA